MIKTWAAKQKKSKRKYDKLTEATRHAKKEFLKYRKGMNIDDPYIEEEGKDDEEEAAVNKPPAKKKNMEFCEYFGRSNHLTKKSKNFIAPKNPIIDAYLLGRWCE
jgi:hypothetical protein